jgi:hypothetical protein
MRYLNSSDLHRQRDTVTLQSRSSFPPMYEKFDAAIDALLIHQHSFSFPDHIPSTPVERVRSHAAKWLYTSIFNFHASLSLAEQGFYRESVILNRALLESLVRVSYLADKPEDIERLPRMYEKIKNQLTIRECFEHVIPGYYAIGYQWSSEFVHPGFASHIFKISPDGAGGSIPDMGIVFNAAWMRLCLNEQAMLLAGFLKTYSARYKEVLRYKNSSDKENIQDATTGVVQALYGHINLNGEEAPWLKTTRPLWDM